ncbi:unnamed protein product [Caenorhabditis auriculariae]|uniref:Uncharacterized protein n=1 Tax=Caenorhabditis auriculariae TaxID=2777116 RepID=A0A8S1HK87_9PELO|nr:unnamed protein product [Caenorhabditis auriculariae]
MSFHDDSHILSRLGILDSMEESPRKKQENAQIAKPHTKRSEKFVDVKLNQELTDSEDSDAAFDRDILLPTNRSAPRIRRRSENVILKLVVIIILFFIAGLTNLNLETFQCGPSVEVLSCAWSCFGLVIGIHGARLICFRVNLLVFMMVSLLGYLFAAVFPIGFTLSLITRGFFIASVLYAGSLAWFGIWRNQQRILLLFLFIFSTGNLFSMLSNSPMADSSNLGHFFQGFRDDPTFVWEAFELANNTNLPSSNDSDRAKKPEVATGSVSKTKTKAEENAEKELEAAKQQKIEESRQNSTVSATLTQKTTISSTTTSTSTTTTTTTTTTTVAPTIPLSIASALPGREETLERDDFKNCPLRKNIPVPFSSSFCSLWATCCVVCRLELKRKPESRSWKMNRPSDLASDCASVRLLSTLLLDSYSKCFISTRRFCATPNCLVTCTWSRVFPHFFACFLLLVIGRRVGTLLIVVASFSIYAVAQLILIISSTSSLAVFSATFGLQTLWVSMFFIVESFLAPRPTVQLAYFLLAWAFGRLFACFFAFEMPSPAISNTVSLTMTVAVGAVLFYGTKLLLKAKKLKEILDNSGAPILGSEKRSGEYISLNTRILDPDDDNDSVGMIDDLLDRSSMDLDFELEQIGINVDESQPLTK